ncbi:MAG TPA: tripartite tricarboxylate transporter TctB family protein [Casimicrobiaceae bacterium]|nr:tripartite tricarboxylate transporter TctB family protein [Casimicrobiaceae bacterium]
MNEPTHADAQARAGIPARLVEAIVAFLIFALGGLVVYDSHRLGSSWAADGPESGYFPFYVGLLLCISSAIILVRAIARPVMRGELFVTWGPLKLVLTVLVPAIVYVLAVQFVGLYVASAVYITVFMMWLGRYSALRSALVGFGVCASLFVMFEIWFKVPLFKGELDPLSFLGY